MQKIDLFERLEVANAQIDIWIDEEEYGEVIKSCEIDQKLKVNEKEDKTLYEVLETAFSHESCTANKDHEWLSMLSHSANYPITKIDLTTQENDRIDIDLVACDVPEAWSHFFWAKLIRARIQQKGTDCYFRRLDQVVAYLERHCPIILPLSQKPNRKNGGNDKERTRNELVTLKNKLAVIYLLEMAASGEGADQRSFAERARRIMRENQRYIRDESFQWFYDLFARYNIGVGYFHEPLYRKAVLEFNLIIKKFRELEGNSAQKAKEDIRKNEEKKKFTQSRLGETLLESPAVLYRAEVQLKLQLAYHAQRTIAEYLESPGPYKQSQADLIVAEAYQQMGRWRQAGEKLCEVYGFTHKVTSLECQRVIEPFCAGPGTRFANLKGRLQELLIASCMNELEEAFEKRESSDVEEIIDYLHYFNRFFEKYKSSTLRQRENRRGYLEQLAEYIGFLADKSSARYGWEKENNSKVIEIAQQLFKNNKDDILASENGNHDCPCKEKGIDLRRLDQNHYDAFTDNIRKFFRRFSGKNRTSLARDQQLFLKRLEKLEKTIRENLNWRLRKIDLEEKGGNSRSWCGKCLPQSTDSSLAFANLLECKKDAQGEQDSESLSQKDYEQIMNHWDQHFLEHMKNPSFHAPRCRAFHFLGLQRWNSTSPAQGRSLGGGYLLYHTDKDGCIDLGVAIDPGFDFVRNLFHMGFSLADIDVVLLSHAHVDHVRDFESMVTLLLELRKRTKNDDKEVKRKLHAIMTLGVYRRLEYIIESPGLREYIEPYILDIEKEIDPKFLNKCKFEFVQEEHLLEKSDKPEPSREPKLVRFEPILTGEEEAQDNRIHLTIAPTKAYHNDFSEYSDSFGFIVNVNDPIEPSIDYGFGYTGDTSWYKDIMKQYGKCDSLLVHLGSLIDREKDERKEFSHYKEGGKECFNLIRDKNHPYLMGMLHFLTEVFKTKRERKKPLILMGEFGEELRGRIRLDFISRLKKSYCQALDILPVDVGLDVLLAWDSSSKCEDPPILKETDKNPKVWCVQCRHFVILDDAVFIHYGHDEALFCVCKTCKKATPDNVLQERLRALYEVGRRLQIH